MRKTLPQQSVLFEELFTKPAQVEFSEPDASSLGGALLVKQLDDSLGLTRCLASSMVDSRDPSRVDFDFLTLVQQRVMGIVCGFEDANDVARYRGDGMMKLMCDLDPASDAGVASQSTLSRFENQVTAEDLVRMSGRLFDLVARRHKKRLGRRARRVTIDLDTTVNYTHGQQQLTMFNGFYDGRCYLPLMAFLSFNDEREQYACATILRSGRPGSAGVLSTLRQLIRRTKKAFPSAEIIVRLDGGFCGAKVLELLDKLGVLYLVGFGKNPVLARFSSAALDRAWTAFDPEKKKAVQFYGSTTKYRARNWKKQKRRVIFKAEIVSHENREPRENQRYVVTNMKGASKALYKQYVARGDSENRIKEAKLGLRADRMSCQTFLANQFRAVLALAALVLFQELRLRARRTSAARWQVERLRTCLIQIGARVTSSARRILIRLPRGHPWADLYVRLAAACTR